MATSCPTTLTRPVKMRPLQPVPEAIKSSVSLDTLTNLPVFNSRRGPSQLKMSSLLSELDISMHRLLLKSTAPSDESLLENLDYDNEAFFSIYPDWEVDEDELGSGACGVVYAARHPETREILFAIKKTSFDIDQSPIHYHAMIKVFKLMHHPYICRYYGCDIVENEIYLYLEYSNQGSIHDLIYKKPKGTPPGIADMDECRRYMRQIIEALDYLHGIDIVHRDLKPANILLHNGDVKVADFGAAKLWYKATDKPVSGNSMAGSPCYFSPEVITDTLDMGPKGAQDIWALGCMLYEMVLGREPWDQLDNIWSLYYLIGIWAQRAREMKSEMPEADRDAPFQMLRGCRVCDEFESDDESAFSVSDDEDDDDDDDDKEDKEDDDEGNDEHVFPDAQKSPVADDDNVRRVSLEKQSRGSSERQSIVDERLKEFLGTTPSHMIGPCDIMDINCIKSAKDLSNPLLSIAVLSGKFDEDSLDFLNLCLQWTPENRPTAAELLKHPFIAGRKSCAIKYTH